MEIEKQNTNAHLILSLPGLGFSDSRNPKSKASNSISNFSSISSLFRYCRFWVCQWR